MFAGTAIYVCSSLQLDEYSIQARLRPALLVLLPLFIFCSVWIPALYQVGIGLTSILVACGLTTALSHLSRQRGRTIQTELVQEWGALPTTSWLRHSDTNLDSDTKKRYHHFLELQVPNWTKPSEQDELMNPTATDKKYSSAIKWLLEFTRDQKKYKLIFKENISFGFRRNAFGLKAFGIVVALTIFLISFANIYNQQLSSVPPAKLASTVFSFIMLTWWLFGVTKAWVKDGAEAYAKALLSACEGI